MFKKFSDSAKNLKDTRVLCTAAVFTALYVVLDMLQIPITPQSRISLTFLPMAVCGWLFGPVPALIVGALGDTVGFLIHPTGTYFPGFCITAILAGLIFGFCLYKRDTHKIIWWIILSKTLVSVFLNILLNTYWLSILYEKAYFVYMITRIVKNIITLPLEIALIFIVITFISRHGIRKIV
ncbi:MAG: folate family ECF transporter S component [Clostridia bacterium]|nr:folate family ECF transporter S component [Clostridia bacterium]